MLSRELIALRRRHSSLTTNRFFSGGMIPGRGIPDVIWHGIRIDEPPWHVHASRLLRFTLGGLAGGEADMHVICNMSEQPVDLELPVIPGRRWSLTMDTSRPPPGDILSPAQQSPHAGRSYFAPRHSVVVLESG